MRTPSRTLALATAFCALAVAAPQALAAATPPVISKTSLSAVTETSATLKATVNPGERKVTDYHFEYIAQADWVADGEQFGAGTKSTPKGEINGNEAELKEGHQVSAPIAELSPATAYRFRLSAKNNQSLNPTLGEEITFSTFAPAPSFGPCPLNEAFRTEQPSALLPDCRAYEQASPLDKNGGYAGGIVPFVRAAPDGSGISFTSDAGIPGGEGSQDLPTYLASRGAGQWSTQGLLPPPSAGRKAEVIGWLPDFSATFDRATNDNGEGETALFARSTANGALTQITPYDSGLREPRPSYAGASADGSQVLFEAKAALPEVPAALEGRSNLYLWERETGQLHLADVMNDGNPPAKGAFAGPYDWVGTVTTSLTEGGAARNYYTRDEHAISEDGSVFFTAAGSGQLYRRINPTQPQSAVVINEEEEECTEAAKACTLHISASEKTDGDGPDGSDAAGSAPAAFMAASKDGAKAFFTSPEKLTDDANTGPEPPAPAIARDTIDGDPENVEGEFIPKAAVGLAEDSEYIYWANPGAGTIGRAKLDGTGTPEDDFITGIGTPRYVAVGPCSGGGQCIYWTNTGPLNEFGDFTIGGGSIGRAELNGAAPAGPAEPEFIPGGRVEVTPFDFEGDVNNPQGIALGPCDGGGECIYWANARAGGCHNDTCDFSESGSIARAEIGGGGVEPEFVPLELSLTETPYGIALDGSHIYWTQEWSGGYFYVKRADLDGESNKKSIFLEPAGSELRQIAVDSGHVYWAAQGEDAIGRANLNLEAASVEKHWIETDGTPRGVALDASHIHYSLNGELQPNPGNDLYRYSATPDAEGHHLTDLTVDPGEDGAEVQGVLGASEDGEYVYFAANGDLDEAGPASQGDCQGLIGQLGATGECNLYLWQQGVGTSFVARLEKGLGENLNDAVNWTQTPRGPFAGYAEKTSRISNDGRTLLFRSRTQLTAYENTPPNGACGKVFEAGVEVPLPCPEFYRYDAESGQISCLTCNPTGAAPDGSSPGLGSIDVFQLQATPPAAILSRNLSADGDRFFFETTEALVGADVDGREGCPQVIEVFGGNQACRDVYEWEAPGSGSCTEDPATGYSPLNGGCLYLLSDGSEAYPSLFADASASGEDAFLFTSSQFVGQDTDALRDVYDVRVNGGLAAQNPPPSPPCEGEACKPATTPPPQSQSPTTPNFQGPGNVHEGSKPRCAKGKKAVRGHGKPRCLKPRRHRKRTRHRR